MEFSATEYSRLKYRVDTVSLNDKCVDKIPELKTVFLEFKDYQTASLTNDLILRFVVLCYDKYSPFVEKLTNIIERKIAVLNYLQVKEFAPDIQLIIKSADAETAKVIYHYCKMQNSLDYLAFVTTVEVYIQMNENLGESMKTAKEAKDTADIVVKLQKIEERIDYLADKLFKRDKDMKDFIGTVLVTEGRRYKITPEDWSE